MSYHSVVPREQSQLNSAWLRVGLGGEPFGDGSLSSSTSLSKDRNIPIDTITTKRPY